MQLHEDMLRDHFELQDAERLLKIAFKTMLGNRKLKSQELLK